MIVVAVNIVRRIELFDSVCLCGENEKERSRMPVLGNSCLPQKHVTSQCDKWLPNFVASSCNQRTICTPQTMQRTRILGATVRTCLSRSPLTPYVCIVIQSNNVFECRHSNIKGTRQQLTISALAFVLSETSYCSTQNIAIRSGAWIQGQCTPGSQGICGRDRQHVVRCSQA
jgi:hypothetical protein